MRRLRPSEVKEPLTTIWNVNRRKEKLLEAIARPEQVSPPELNTARQGIHINSSKWYAKVYGRAEHISIFLKSRRGPSLIDELRRSFRGLAGISGYQRLRRVAITSSVNPRSRGKTG